MNAFQHILLSKIFLIILFGLLLANSSNLSSQNNNKKSHGSTPKGASISQKLEIPFINAKDDIIYHSAYTLCYNEECEQASWVAYELTREETFPKFKRKDKFIPDPLVKTGSAENKDYSRSGYDRGHLAPAADMAFSKISIDESFYFSNMSPQVPSFNRGIWKKLEEKVRDWARKYQQLYVVTGPVLEKGLKSIGYNKVSVPKYYYKVLLKVTATDTAAIGFILPNKASSKTLQSFIVSVDSVEKLTSIDFYPLLKDHLENVIEAKINIIDW